MNIKDKKILIVATISSAVISSLVTYFATKTNYQEKYYAQLLDQQEQNKIHQRRLNKYIQPNMGNSKAY